MPLSLQDLQDVVINALEDIKGQHILVFDAQPLTSLFDRVIIASGTSNRQTRALAKNLHDKVKQSTGLLTFSAVDFAARLLDFVVQIFC